ncbi:MAG TPA: hypothetical protein VG714_07190 [Acidobacteriaceae bacterium]|nr:hypothetical protein [Acidobacteriaceae bacterium]
MMIELMATTSALRAWQQNPAQTKREIDVWQQWKNGGPEMDLPLTDAEVSAMKEWLQAEAPTTFAPAFSDWS